MRDRRGSPGQTGGVRGVGVRWRVGVAVTVVVVGLAACGGGSGGDGNPGALFPDRPNQYREDQERALGDAARLSGYTTTVTGVTYDGGEVTVSVRVENRDDEAQPMFATDWSLVSPGGHTFEPVSSTLPSTGEVGDEPVAGDVVFRVDATAAEAEGDFYVLYKPDALDAAQGVWSFTVPDAAASVSAP